MEQLKIKRGSLRLPIVVKPTDGTNEILEAATQKFAMHIKNFYEKYPQPKLFYADGLEVVDLPEGGKFNVKGYKEQTGKEYNRILLYIGSSAG